jgi:hypothetical protein
MFMCQQLYFMKNCYLYKFLDHIIMNLEIRRIPGPRDFMLIHF